MKRWIALSCTLLLGACGSTHTYTVAAVPVPAYLNDEIPENVPQLVSVDEDFSSADESVSTSSSSTSGRTTTTTYRWSKKNYMASGLWSAAQEVAEEDGQPVLVNAEFQLLSRFAAGDTYDYGWFDGHLTYEED